MEYANEGDMENYFASRPFVPEDEAKLITSQIVSGLSWLHKLKIGHRDLKPAVSAECFCTIV